MEHEHAVGGVVGDSGTWEIDGTVERFINAAGEVVAIIDRDPKYQLNLGSCVKEHLTHTEETLQKVYDALGRVGLTDQQRIDAIFDMQNNGIYFREAERD